MFALKSRVKRHRLFNKKCSLLLAQSTLRVCHIGFESSCIRPVTVAWSVESLPSNSGSIPGGVRNLISGIGCVSFVCVLPYDVTGGGPDIVLTTHSGRPALVYMSSVLIQGLLLPYRHLTHRHMSGKSQGGVSPRLGEGK